MPSAPAWVLVVDAHDVFAANLARALTAEDDLRVIGTVRSLSEARWLLLNAVPDVVLIDHQLPDGDAAAALPDLQALQPGVRFLLLTAGVDDDVLVRAVEGGACGFVEKTESLAALCSAVRLAHGGDAVVPSDELGRLLTLMNTHPEASRVRLAERDRHLLALMAEGLSNAEIADRLALTRPALHRELAALCARLGAHCRLSALSIACRQGLLPRRLDTP